MRLLQFPSCLRAFVPVCLLLLCIPLQAAESTAAPAIRHRFLAVDESRAKLHFVSQLDPGDSWSIQLPTRCRDYQLIGNQQLLLSGDDGYFVYDLSQKGKLVKELHDPQFKGTATVRRLADGRTLIGCNANGITFFELAADNSILRTANFPKMQTLRLMRVTPQGTVLFGANDTHVVEADLDGHVIKSIQLANSKHIYQILRQPNGNLLISTGYGSAVVEIDPSGKLVHQLGGQPAPAGVSYHFFAGMQVLKNGDTVVCNWTGHGANDSTIAPQLLEFSPAGELRWIWHDATLAGTLHGVIILDDLDTSRLNEETTGILGAR